MNNLDFFKACFSNELKATYDVLCALPSDKLDYKPHPVNRSAYEIAEHIVAHICDMDAIFHQSVCDEKISHPFDSPIALAEEMKGLWEKALADLANISIEQWQSETVELTYNGMSLFTVPRMMMAWAFLNDIIHHRGQLSTYIRPMGGKVPAIYGFSADTPLPV